MMTEKEPTLIVRREETPVFTSHSDWLYPLLELEAYLAEHPVQPERLVLQDTIIGKAAALLITRLGFRTVTARRRLALRLRMRYAEGLGFFRCAGLGAGRREKLGGLDVDVGLDAWTIHASPQDCLEALCRARDEIGLEYIGFTIYSLPTDVQTRIDYLQMIAEDIVAKV